MNRMNLIYSLLSFLSFFFLSSFSVFGQQTIDASGGEASGSGGIVSYSVGQVLYNSFSDTNNSEAQGVQQPYEISVINGTELVEGIILKYKIYPNPAHSQLLLEIENDLPDAFIQLFDIVGKLIITNQVSSGTNQINLDGLIPATYILKLTSGKNFIQAFKVVKN